MVLGSRSSARSNEYIIGNIEMRRGGEMGGVPGSGSSIPRFLVRDLLIYIMKNMMRRRRRREDGSNYLPSFLVRGLLIYY
jgi:hypothetical protein